MISEKLEEGIIVLDSFIDPNLCLIFKEYADKMCTEKRSTLGNAGHNFRDVRGYCLGSTLVSDKILFQNVHNEIYKAYFHYKIKFPRIETTRLSQVEFLKYEKNQKYDYHVDGFGEKIPRTLSLILNLNEGYKGGDLVFAYQNLKEEMKRVKLKKGSIVMFPSNYLYPHRIEPIIEGTRYSIVSWLS